MFLGNVVGGYFGSRLMNNIREKNGISYSIYSRMVSVQKDGLFVIRTDVNKKQAKKAVQEIFAEIKNLQKEPIPQEEMWMAKNYLFGACLRDFDGTFAQLDRMILLCDYDLPSDYWHKYMETIEKITPERLMELANLYLQTDDMTVVIVG